MPWTSRQIGGLSSTNAKTKRTGQFSRSKLAAVGSHQADLLINSLRHSHWSMALAICSERRDPGGGRRQRQQANRDHAKLDRLRADDGSSLYARLSCRNSETTPSFFFRPPHSGANPNCSHPGRIRSGDWLAVCLPGGFSGMGSPAV